MRRPSGCERVLNVLRAARGQWVRDLYRITRAMVHSRVADLRRRGHDIECRRIDGAYCYRLVRRERRAA